MSERRRSVWLRHISWVKRTAPWNFATAIAESIFNNIDYIVLAAISAWFGATIARDSVFAAWQIALGAAIIVAFGAVPAWAARAIQKRHREARYVFPPNSKSDFIWIKPGWDVKAEHNYHDCFTYDPFNHSTDINNNFYVYKRDDISAVYDQDRDIT